VTETTRVCIRCGAAEGSPDARGVCAERGPFASHSFVDVLTFDTLYLHRLNGEVRSMRYELDQLREDVGELRTLLFEERAARAELAHEVFHADNDPDGHSVKA